MVVKVHIHTTHRQFTNGSDVVAVEGNTVGECLNHLIKQFPGDEGQRQNFLLQRVIDALPAGGLASRCLDGRSCHWSQPSDP